MRKLQKIYGYLLQLKPILITKLRHKRVKNLDERGFVLLELIIGLPLILIMLWAMGNTFINTYQQCKIMTADFILQQEMESAMLRIVDDAKAAYNFKEYYSQKIFKHHTMTLNDISIKDTDETTEGKPWYKIKDNKLYRNGDSSPITGDDILSDVKITMFKCKQVPGHSKLLQIRIEGRSNVSNHKMVLTTQVFMKGYGDE